MGKKHCVEEIGALDWGLFTLGLNLALHVRSAPAYVGANLNIVLSCC